MEQENVSRKFVELEDSVHGRTKKACVDIRSNMKEIVNVVLDKFLDDLKDNPEQVTKKFYLFKSRFQDKREEGAINESQTK